MKFEIENKPIVSQRDSCLTKYPLNELEIGQSFFVPNGKHNSLSVMCSYYGKKLSKKFRCLAEKNGYRIGRVK